LRNQNNRHFSQTGVIELLTPSAATLGKTPRLRSGIGIA
jgi:hypothetical protein